MTYVVRFGAAKLNLKNNVSMVLVMKVTSNKQPDVDLRPAGIDVALTGGDCTRAYLQTMVWSLLHSKV
jgi:hypothetical protein